MKRFSYYFIFPFLAICFFTLVSCSNASTETTSAADISFSQFSWENTLEDILAAEGNPQSTYDSVYGGLCYTFPKDYLNKSGTIKYMFDADSKLVSIAWAFSSEDPDELQKLYNTINTSIIDKYGESEYNPQNVTNYGNVWYRDSGNIILSTMLTAENKALQIAYLHPSVSSDPPKKKP